MDDTNTSFDYKAPSKQSNDSQVDFEDLVDQQNENDMPKHVIWLELE